LSQRLERLDDESAFREFEAGLFQGSVIENKHGASDLVGAVRAIRIYRFRARRVRTKAAVALIVASISSCSPPAAQWTITLSRSSRSGNVSAK